MTNSPTCECHRLFIAISVPAAVKAEVEKVQKELASLLSDDAVRWSRPEFLHLTLRFLGNVATSRTNELVEKLSSTRRKFAPLQLRAERIGFFPEHGLPRVLWIAVSDKSQQLERLQSAIQTATLDFTSESAEKEFASHITVGRSRKIRRPEADILNSFAARMHRRLFGEWFVDSVELFKSDLLPDGPRHSLLGTFRLGDHG